MTLLTGNSGRGSMFLSVAIYGLLLLSVVTFQQLSGALGSELVDPDEPAHFISGLLIRDYIAGGLGMSPLDYARDYYAHYPKVAIGNWPPLFHALEGAWLLVAPARPSSVLILLAVVTAAVALLIFRMLRSSVGVAHALAGAVLFMVMGPVPAHVSGVKIELPMALATTASMLLFARYLDDMRLRHAAAFGGACIVAVLTKGNALFLALLPPFVILIERRWSVLRKPGLWYAAALVILLAGPWTVYFLSTAQAGWRDALPSVGFMSRAGSYYLAGFYRALGWVALVASAIGLWDRVLRPGSIHARDSTLWVSAAALILAVLAFHVLVPAGIEQRHMIPAYPAFAMFAAGGTFRVTKELQRRGMRGWIANCLVIGLLILGFGSRAFSMPSRVSHGYGEAAALVVDAGGDSVAVASLIVADASGEGAFVVEVAVRDVNRPRHIVWRGTNLLSTATWAGREYRLRADGDAAVIRLLEEASIRMVVLDRSRTRFRHQPQIEAAIAANPERFSLVRQLPVRRGRRVVENGITVFELLPGPDWTPSDEPRIRQVPGYDGIAPR